jgi:methionine synthase II (cobalamin-independent)
VIHLPEPWLAYFGIDETSWSPFEAALQTLRDALDGRATVVLHLPFGDAAPHAERLRRLPVDAVGIDFVETDLDSLGSTWEVGLLAGCLDGRRSPLEDPEAVARFVADAAERLAPPTLYLSSNSDLELLPRDVARDKVLRLGEASSRLKELLA